jgi:hypothetical protein
VTGAIDCRIGAQRAQNAQAGHYVASHQWWTDNGALAGRYNETAHICRNRGRTNRRRAPGGGA